MKYLLISNMYPSKKSPHYGIFIKNFEIALENKKNTIQHRIVLKGKSYNKVILSLKYLVFYFKIIIKGILFRDYDAIYVHYPIGAALPVFLISIINRKPLILNFHGGDLLDKDVFYTLFSSLQEILIRKANLIVVPSNYFKKLFVSKYPIQSNKIFVYPSGGINFSIFNKKSKELCRQVTNTPSKDFVIGYVSHIIKDKGWDIFLQALLVLKKDHYDIKAIIIGNGVDREELISFIKDNNLIDIVLYRPSMTQDNLSIFYNSMDLFVFPTKLEESLGLVGLEALSCGVPTIGTRIGALPDFINHGVNGYLFEKNNFNELSEFIKKYYHLDDREKIEFCKKALEISVSFEKNFSATLLNEKLNEIF